MPSPILPFKGIPSIPSRPSVGGPPRAQNINLGKLQQKVDREQAAVSMSQLMSRKAGVENTRSTSVAHIGQSTQTPTTSVSHKGNAVGSVYDTTTAGQADSAADDRRYTYMRKLIKERQAKEAMAAKKAAEGKGLNFGTGSSFKKSGATGLHKKVSEEFRAHKTTYGSLNSKEKQVLEDTIASKLSSKTTGSSVSSYDKRQMKKQISKAHDSGDVSTLGHAKILKKFIDKIN